MTKKLESVYIRGVCTECGINKQAPIGGGKFRHICNSCHTKKYPSKIAKKKERRNLWNRVNGKYISRPYLHHKKGYCELCGFLPLNSCQLDVDHVDGNHQNNSPENLQTLCANCHRLKTFLNKDWEVS